MKRFLAVAVFALAPLCAQTLNLSVFDRLKDKASDSTDVNLSKDLLGLAAGVLGNDKDSDAAKAKKVVEGLSGVLVRSLEFDKEGVYSEADVQQLITELGSTGWKLVISADEKHGKSREISRIWIKTAEGELGGLRILSAEPKELSVVEISGRIRLQDLKDLGGNLGIPNLDVLDGHSGASDKKKKDDE
jgi:hypothetical protein